MKYLLLIALLLFAGCDEPTEQSLPTETELIEYIEPVSNIGNNINGYGYYGDDVVFGSIKMSEFTVLARLDSDDLVMPDKIYLHSYKNESFHTTSEIYESGTYGVNEDGTELTEKWIVSETSIKYNYVSDMSINGIPCIKVLIDSLSYAMCK